MKGILFSGQEKTKTNEQKKMNRLPYIRSKESKRETILMMFHWKKEFNIDCL